MPINFPGWLNDPIRRILLFIMGIVVIGVLGGYLLLTPEGNIFQRFFGGPYDEFVQKWNELLEISKEMEVKSLSAEVEIQAGYDCSAALASDENAKSEIERISGELDKFDQKVPEAEKAANRIADPEAKEAAGKLVKYAKDSSDIWHEILPPGEQIVDLAINRDKALIAIGCVTQANLEQALNILADFIEAAVPIYNGKLAPFLTSERLVVLANEAAAAHQEWQDATGIILFSLGTPSIPELGY